MLTSTRKKEISGPRRSLVWTPATVVSRVFYWLNACPAALHRTARSTSASLARRRRRRGSASARIAVATVATGRRRAASTWPSTRCASPASRAVLSKPLRWSTTRFPTEGTTICSGTRPTGSPCRSGVMTARPRRRTEASGTVLARAHVATRCDSAVHREPVKLPRPTKPAPVDIAAASRRRATSLRRGGRGVERPGPMPWGPRSGSNFCGREFQGGGS